MFHVCWSCGSYQLDKQIDLPRSQACCPEYRRDDVIVLDGEILWQPAFDTPGDSYLALTCDDAVLEARLRSRPAWRESGQEAFITAQLAFNRWLRDPPADVAPRLARLDTSASTLEESCTAVASWITTCLALA